MSSLSRFHYDSFAELDRLFDDAFNARCCPSVRVRRATTNTPQHLDSFRPRTDVTESKDANTVTATFELPGLKPEDVAIDLEQNRLTVSGESSTSNAQEEEGVYAVRERRYGKFSRTLQLPFGTKPGDINANMENGLLTVTFPRVTPEQQPQRIAIQ